MKSIANKSDFPAPIPVTILGGFLGAGKTTVLNHVLTEDHGVKAAVLVNDFGAINIDAKLVVGVEGEKAEMSNGCICCSIRGDLVKACLELLENESGLEHLLIEMSGVSDPEPVIETFYDSDVRDYFAVNAVLTVVDAETLPELEGDVLGLVKRQIEYADIVVVNKMDLVDQRQLEVVKQLVQRVAPGSRILAVKYGRIPFELVFGDELRTPGSADHLTRPAKGHHHSPSGHMFTTWNWTSNQPLSLIKLRATLAALPDSIYRCKGFIYIEELTQYRYILQMVGKRLVIIQGGLWDEREPVSEFVLIGSNDGIDPTGLQQRFDACIGTDDESQSPILRLVKKLDYLK